jgi:hypothetical protein
MKFRLPFLIAIVFAVAACDPAATTRLLIRPVSPASEDSQASIGLQQVELIGTLLQARGFTKKSYENPHVPAEDQKSILTDCGHLSYWMREVNHHTMWAHVCLKNDGVLVSLVDYLSVTAPPATQALAKELAAEISTFIKNVRLEVSQ